MKRKSEPDQSWSYHLSEGIWTAFPISPGNPFCFVTTFAADQDRNLLLEYSSISRPWLSKETFLENFMDPFLPESLLVQPNPTPLEQSEYVNNINMSTRHQTKDVTIIILQVCLLQRIRDILVFFYVVMYGGGI